MTDDLVDLVARELSRASLDTVDCPDLFQRVEAGVYRRRRRRRSLVAAVATVAVVAVTPTLGLGGPDSHPGGTAAGPRFEASQESARADLALRRANPLDLPALRPVGADLSCLHHPYCRGPV